MPHSFIRHLKITRGFLLFNRTDLVQAFSLINYCFLVKHHLRPVDDEIDNKSQIRILKGCRRLKLLQIYQKKLIIFVYNPFSHIFS